MLHLPTCYHDEYVLIRNSSQPPVTSQLLRRSSTGPASISKMMLCSLSKTAFWWILYHSKATLTPNLSCRMISRWRHLRMLKRASLMDQQRRAPRCRYHIYSTNVICTSYSNISTLRIPTSLFSSTCDLIPKSGIRSDITHIPRISPFIKLRAPHIALNRGADAGVRVT
jgi:hypothetical protein